MILHKESKKERNKEVINRQIWVRECRGIKMGKQTKKNNSTFGGFWTEKKLVIIEKYLNFYTTALKNQKFKKIYIDAFAGSGFTEMKTGEVLIGSALLSLQYDFDEYYFLDTNKDNLE